jgi:hypothetical protein
MERSICEQGPEEEQKKDEQEPNENEKEPDGEKGIIKKIEENLDGFIAKLLGKKETPEGEGIIRPMVENFLETYRDDLELAEKIGLYGGGALLVLGCLWKFDQLLTTSSYFVENFPHSNINYLLDTNVWPWQLNLGHAWAGDALEAQIVRVDADAVALLAGEQAYEKIIPALSKKIDDLLGNKEEKGNDKNGYDSNVSRGLEPMTGARP